MLAAVHKGGSRAAECQAKRLREKARSLPSGRLRDEIEKKAIQVEAACEVTELLRLPAVTALQSAK